MCENYYPSFNVEDYRVDLSEPNIMRYDFDNIIGGREFINMFENLIGIYYDEENGDIIKQVYFSSAYKLKSNAAMNFYNFLLSGKKGNGKHTMFSAILGHYTYLYTKCSKYDDLEFNVNSNEDDIFPIYYYNFSDYTEYLLKDFSEFYSGIESILESALENVEFINEDLPTGCSIPQIVIVEIGNVEKYLKSKKNRAELFYFYTKCEKKLRSLNNDNIKMLFFNRCDKLCKEMKQSQISMYSVIEFVQPSKQNRADYLVLRYKEYADVIDWETDIEEIVELTEEFSYSMLCKLCDSMYSTVKDGLKEWVAYVNSETFISDIIKKQAEEDLVESDEEITDDKEENDEINEDNSDAEETNIENENNTEDTKTEDNEDSDKNDIKVNKYADLPYESYKSLTEKNILNRDSIPDECRYIISNKIILYFINMIKSEILEKKEKNNVMIVNGIPKGYEYHSPMSEEEKTAVNKFKNEVDINIENKTEAINELAKSMTNGQELIDTFNSLPVYRASNAA